MFVSRKKYEQLERDYAALKLSNKIDAEYRKKFANTLEYIVEQETAVPNATMTRVLTAAKEALGK